MWSKKVSQNLNLFRRVDLNLSQNDNVGTEINLTVDGNFENILSKDMNFMH